VVTLPSESSLSLDPAPAGPDRAALLDTELPGIIDTALARTEIAASLADPEFRLSADELRRRAQAQREVVCAPADGLLAEYLAAKPEGRTEAAGAPALGRRRVAWATVVDLLLFAGIAWVANTWWSANAFLDVVIVIGAVTVGIAFLIVVLAVFTPTSDSRARAALRDRRRLLEQWRAVVLADGVLPLFRSVINERGTPLQWSTMRVAEAPGLDRVRELSLVVDTQSSHRFHEALAQVRTGAIGVAGSRGVGKTTLLEKHLSDQRRGIAVLVSAPVRYDAREFVLHLYATLCRTALGRWEPRGRRWWRAFRPTPPRLLGYLVLMGILLVGGWELVGVTVDRPVAGPAELVAAVHALPAPAFRLWPTFLLWLAAALLPEFVAFAALRERFAGVELTAVLETNRRLSRIRFLQTTTTGWSGTLTVPGGQAARTGAAQQAELPLTYPEIVAELRQYLGALVGWLPPQAGVLVVIDELDKIESAEHAQNFVNEIKGILGVDGTQFVITVSEDALSAFERRGLPVRDAFDSTFDEVVWIEALNVTESCTLLQKRVIGLSDLFCSLAHCMSGGLPRDLIRTARLMRSIAGADRARIDAVCRQLVGNDLARKIRAYQVATGDLSGEPGTAAFVRTLRGLTADPGQLRTALRELVAEHGDGALKALGLQAAVYIYHCATVLEVFTEDLAEAEFDRRRETLDELARAKQSLSTHPEVAWQMLDEARAALGLEVVPLDEP
jgi:hypothetical protein